MTDHDLRHFDPDCLTRGQWAELTSTPPSTPATAVPLELPVLPKRDVWMRQAACRDSDPAVFYPTRGDTLTEARAVCADCPVRQACLDYALDNSEQHGIWGGLTLRERRRIRREKAA